MSETQTTPVDEDQSQTSFVDEDVDIRKRLYIFAGVLILVFLITLGLWIAGV